MLLSALLNHKQLNMLHMVHCLKSEHTDSQLLFENSHYCDAHVVNAILKFYIKLLFVVFKFFPVITVINIVTIPIFSVILGNMYEQYVMSKHNCGVSQIPNKDFERITFSRVVRNNTCIFSSFNMLTKKRVVMHLTLRKMLLYSRDYSCLVSIKKVTRQ